MVGRQDVGMASHLEESLDRVDVPSVNHTVRGGPTQHIVRLRPTQRLMQQRVKVLVVQYELQQSTTAVD